MGERIAMSVEMLDGLDSPLDPRFGRAQGFLVVQDGQTLAQLDNQGVDAAHGAGINAAALMGEHGVGVVISGAFGPKAHAALSELGIEMRLAPPGLNAKQAMAAFARGELQLQQMAVLR
jgi:predicted Fe-Mo cluster-binding NifX family protein